MSSIKKLIHKEMRGSSISRHYTHRSSQISALSKWEAHQPQTNLVEAFIYG
jgi:hypothetical protein